MGVDTEHLRLAGILRRRALAGPERLEIEVTNTCNIRCQSCWFFSPRNPSPKSRKIHFPLQDFLRIIGEARTLGAGSLCITGVGEPTQHRDIVRMIAAARRAALPLHLATNMTTGRPAVLKAMLLCNQVAVTFLAPDPEGYALIQAPGRPELFRRVVANLRWLREHRRGPCPRLCLMFIPTRLNAGSFDRMVALAEDIGVDELKVQPFDATRHTRGLALPPKAMAAFAARVRDAARDHPVIGTDFFGEYEAQRRSPTEKRVCYMGYYTMLVGISGEVRIGCFSPHNPPSGNCFRDSLGSIWRSAAAALVRERYVRDFTRAHGTGPCCPFLLINARIRQRLAPRPQERRPRATTSPADAPTFGKRGNTG